MTSANTLSGETSPYLLQHADNPVHWMPWGPQALDLAKSLNKPILLSVGYSACHWCHVMAHESFEHAPTAARMNELFVNIKVDREERPDLDKIYQLAHQLLTRRAGGWPLTVFLTPDDHLPFFAGTYFPREPRHGMPAFSQVLEALSEYYRDRRDEIDGQRGAILEALASTEPTQGCGDGALLTPAPLSAARAELERSFDTVDGGFGSAPKFPHPTNLSRLLRHYSVTSERGEPDPSALSMATTTLTRMAEGGIYDHLGGGFCRYSVDEKWMIPHFEKMLYDNGPLLELCANAWDLTGDERYARTARETAGWVMREMQAPDGGYYSSIDADSEGEEGKFYVWQRDEVRALLSDDEFACLSLHFGLNRSPNFENHAWHLHTFVPVNDVARELGMQPNLARERIDSARQILERARSQRVRPGLDDKILAAWNALMIRGMCAAGRSFGEAAWVDCAQRAMDYVRNEMFVDGRLLATARNGRAHLDAYLDDHALLIDASLALLMCRWRRADLDFACVLAEALLARFQDDEHGGFFFTAHDHEQLIHRPKPMMDDALPAGNAVAAAALGRLGHILGEQRYLDASERTVRAGLDGLNRFPHAHTALLDALEDILYPPQTIIVRGEAANLSDWQQVLDAGYQPRRVALAIPADETDLPGLLAARRMGKTTTAYVCQGHHCDAPVDSLGAFREKLRTAGH